jgi:hypothetical protein
MMWITRRKTGGWTVLLPGGELKDLEKLPADLRKLLESPDFSSAVVRRLFPAAYLDDPRAEAELQGLLREDLVRKKMEGVEAFERTLRARREKRIFRGLVLVEVDLTDEDLALWLGFLHDIRLTIGNRLDITEDLVEKRIDPRHPHAREMELLHRLAWLEELILQALREAEKIE